MSVGRPQLLPQGCHARHEVHPVSGRPGHRGSPSARGGEGITSAVISSAGTQSWVRGVHCILRSESLPSHPPTLLSGTLVFGSGFGSQGVLVQHYLCLQISPMGTLVRLAFLRSLRRQGCPPSSGPP